MDTSTIMFMMFFFAVVAVIMLFVMGAVNTAFSADSSLPDLTKTVMSRGTSTSAWVFDFWFIVLFVGLPLISMALAYFVNIPPVFFWIGVLLNIVLLLVAKALSTIWVSMMSDTLISTAQSMPIMNYVMSNYQIYMLFVFLLIAAGTYMKTRNSGVYG